MRARRAAGRSPHRPNHAAQVLPVIFHWKLYGFYSQTMLERIWGIFVVAAGLTAGVIGGYGAIEGLIAAFNDP